MKPRLLDLFCGAGGAAMGYHRAGFEVLGVDIEPQPNYPFRFIQADAIDYAAGSVDWTWLEGFDAIHASPPCQAYTSMNREHEQAATRAKHPALIAETRELLEATGLPYVIENVAGAVSELRGPIQLCGRGLGIALHRHRLFEMNFPVMSVPCTGGRDPFGVYGKLDGRLLWRREDGSELRAPKTLEEAQEAMGMDWSGWDGLREAIPPAFTGTRGLLPHGPPTRPAEGRSMTPCWFADLSTKPCDGPRMRAHLIRQRRLKDSGHDDLCDDPRSWVWACLRCHGNFDNGFLYPGQPAANVLELDQYPPDFLELMAENGYEFGGHRGWRLNRLREAA